MRFKFSTGFYAYSNGGSAIERLSCHNTLADIQVSPNVVALWREERLPRHNTGADTQVFAYVMAFWREARPPRRNVRADLCVCPGSENCSLAGPHTGLPL